MNKIYSTVYQKV